MGYGKCLAIEPDYADAHYDLARLKELRGDKQGALRHYNAYRRIQGSRTSLSADERAGL
nr:tetratricopeptide repeat protein [Paraburkholderia sp. BL10I2N1]